MQTCHSHAIHVARCGTYRDMVVFVMSSVFIDANILLGFWSCSTDRVPSDLLLPLVELREHILVTKQVADEVARRKLGVFIENRGKFTAELPPRLAHHMLGVRAHAEASDAVAALGDSAREAKRRWESACAEIADAISQHEDLATTMLLPLLGQAVEATAEQLQAARSRRERGNPPGKRSDPLGDQVSWEQFLTAAAGRERVWIVTRDRDFQKTIGSTRLLNPFLRAELSAAGVGAVELHNGLASAILSMRTAGLAAGPVVPEARLRELGEEETAAARAMPPVQANEEWQCPRCGEVNLGAPLIARPSRYGGWSYWAHCGGCGVLTDTGEPYDD